MNLYQIKSLNITNLKDRNKNIVFISILIFIISFFIFSANIGGISIYSLDEAKNSECAREMLERGDFIVPTFNYELRTDKPPLHYYFMMLSYKLFGINEFSARFFSTIFGALTVLITFLFSYRYLGLKVGILSSTVLLSSIHTSIQFHMAVPDPYLIFFINATLFSFFIGIKEKKRVFIYLAYIFIGFGILSKGPVALVLPTVIIFVYLLLTKNLRYIKFLNIPIGIVLTVLISLPWYIAVYIKTDGIWVKEFLFKHNIHRFSDSMEGHGGIFLITFLFVFVGLLPFSIFILQALKNAFKNRKNDIILFSLVFSSVYIIFFAISKTKLPNYTVPAYPPLAILLGYYLQNIKRFSKFSIITTLTIYTILTVLIVIGLFIGISNEKSISDLNYLAFGFIILTIGGFLSALSSFKNKIYVIPSLSLSSIITGLIFFYILFPKIDKRNPVSTILPLIDKTKEIYHFRGFNPAFVFYLKKHIKGLSRGEIKNKKDIYILSRMKYMKELKDIKGLTLIKSQKDLFEKPTSILLYKDKK